jgi:hypothetical protein
MTTWCDALNDENAVLSQVLYRDDGRPRGMIVRYYEDAPTDAWVRVSAARDAGDYFVFDAKRSVRAQPTRRRALRSSRP